MNVRIAASLVALATVVTACRHEVTSPPLADASALPTVVCEEQKTTRITLTGGGFTPMPQDTLTASPHLALPAVKVLRTKDLTGAAASGTTAIPDDPAHAEASLVHWTSEAKLAFDVAPSLSLASGLYDVQVTNPDGKTQKTFGSAFAAVPRPAVSTTSPDILCDADGDVTVELHGTGILRIGTSLPAVKLGDKTFAASAVSGCATVPGNHPEGEVASCTSATFVIPKGTFDPGDYPLTLTNPAPADCVSTDAVLVTIVPAPSISSLAPDLVCDAQTDQRLVLKGQNFLQLGSTLPTVTFGTQQVTADALSDCTAATPRTLAEGAAQLCKTLNLTVPAGLLAPDAYPVQVQNPAPAACTSHETVSLMVVAPPAVTQLVPAAVCDAQGAQSVVLQGTGFLKVGSTLPTVTIGGTPVTATSADGCADVPGTFSEGAAQQCTSLTVQVPQNTLSAGPEAVAVTNPAPADCHAVEAPSLHVDAPPQVTSMNPHTVCSGGGKLSINGTGFTSTSTVSLALPGGTPFVTAAENSASSDGTVLQATFGATGSPGTTYDVVVDDHEGCTDPAPHEQVVVTAGPIAFYADPPVVYDGISTRVTIYVTALQAPLPANAVTLVPSGGGAAQTLAWSAVPGHPNRVQAVIPAGTAPGSYDLQLVDGTGCPTTLPQGIQVTNALTVAVKTVTPPFGDVAHDTSVTVVRDTSAAAPADKPFLATPRLFLNPTNPQPSDVAIALPAVSFVDANTLTAVVPANEPVHGYDLVLVNPDGSVGVFANAFHVQAAPPPAVSAVTPSSIVDATGQQVTVSGTHFTSSQVSASCVDTNGNALAAPHVTSGTTSCDASANCTQSATVDGSALPVGTICVLRVTNADGSYFDYSAIGVTNSSLNLPGTHAGTALNVGRRALVTAAGNATSASRFVYAIGGDGGASAQAAPFNSVEAASVDLYGHLGPWHLLPASAMNHARSFASSAVVGRYVYVSGGFDGTNALASAERALILSPLEVPALDVDDLVPAATGLSAGDYLYRVSATFAANDPDNPGGESLASDEFTVRVPSFTGKGIQVVLTWSAPVDSTGAVLPNVSGYRIYRSAANGGSGSEVLLTTVPASQTRFTDDGTLVPGTTGPLPAGSLGKWAVLPNMGSARQGAAGAAAFDPANPSKFYVYALLGKNSAGQALASYEYLPVTIQANGRQTVGAAWLPGVSPSSTGRWQHNAWVADRTTSSAISSPDTWIFVGGGLLANGTTTGKVEAGKVLAGGDLGLWSDTPKDFSNTLAGYGVCAANDQLFAFGGAGAAPSSGAKSASLVSPAPALANNSWNSEGITLVDSRYLAGSAVQSAFIFLVGGQTATSAASTSTELVIW